MKKQYIVQKYVMADSATEAVTKSKRLPVHEVYVHNQWFEKAAGFEFNQNVSKRSVGFKKKR